MDPTAGCLRRTIPVIAGLLLVMAFPAPVLSAEDATLQVQSHLWFEGSSTLGGWACREVPVRAEVALPELPADDDALFRLLTEASDTAFRPRLQFPVKKIGCEEGERMNNHMRNALRADEHPEVTFRVRAVRSTRRADTPPGAVRADVEGQLTVSGTTRGVRIPTTLRVTDGDPAGLRVRGDLELDMTEYGVEPPTLMYGTLSVHKTITVHAVFELIPSSE